MHSLWLWLVLAVWLVGCSTPPAPPEHRILNAATEPAVVADWLIAGRNDFLVIDLRERAAYDAAHIPGAIHLKPEALRESLTLNALPSYKKLVFYGADDGFDAKLLAPVFARGLTVQFIRGGYQGWRNGVLAVPENTAPEGAARKAAVAKYLRGESALGTPTPIKGFSTESLVRPPELDVTPPAPANEGC